MPEAAASMIIIVDTPLKVDELCGEPCKRSDFRPYKRKERFLTGGYVCLQALLFFYRAHRVAT